jgi:hypothetical protein
MALFHVSVFTHLEVHPHTLLNLAVQGGLSRTCQQLSSFANRVD